MNADPADYYAVIWRDVYGRLRWQIEHDGNRVTWTGEYHGTHGRAASGSTGTRWGARRVANRALTEVRQAAFYRANPEREIIR